MEGLGTVHPTRHSLQVRLLQPNHSMRCYPLRDDGTHRWEEHREANLHRLLSARVRRRPADKNNGVCLISKHADTDAEPKLDRGDEAVDGRRFAVPNV